MLFRSNNTYSVEFATFFNAIGTKTTLINPEKSIIPYEDKTLASTLERQLKKDGVKIVSEARPKSFKGESLIVERKGKEETYSADNFWTVSASKYFNRIIKECNLGIMINRRKLQ